MQRKRRIPNPYHKAIAVNWRLAFDKTNQRLDITFRGEFNGFSNNTLSLPAIMMGTRCLPRKIGTLKKCNKSGDVVEEVPFSLIPNDYERMLSKWEKILNNVVEEVGKVVSRHLSSVRGLVDEVSGTAIIPPKILRIPKKITVGELSLEELQEAGQLPKDLTKFKRM